MLLTQSKSGCFSYIVSVDGIHVCHPQNAIEYESTGEDENESNPQTLVGYEGTGEDENEHESDPQNLVEHKSAEAADPKRECPCSLLQRRGKSNSEMRLAFSTSTQCTLVNISAYRAGESSVAGHTRPDSGNYDFIKLIGIDGEGVIHLMKSRSTNQFIVRKTVKYARWANAKPIEAAILQDIFPDRHDNVIRLHAFEPYQALESDRVDGARYYFEYCSAGDLHQLVNQYKARSELLPELFIWQAYQQLCSALEFLHRGFDPRCSDPNRRGVCHRDIKPSNIFLRLSRSEYPDVVLADFGHASLDFATYDPAGTSLWQGPELPRHSPKGDVYSLGAVMHFLIHFKAPIARLPDGAPDTEFVKDAWASAPEARKPIMESVVEYSEELVCAMLMALEADENKRKDARQLLRFLNHCFEQTFPPDTDLCQEAEDWPLAEWAFDHMVPAGGTFEEDDDDEEEETGAQQYFEMMEMLGCGVSRESSRRSSPAPSDPRRGVAGRDPRAGEMSSIASLG